MAIFAGLLTIGIIVNAASSWNERVSTIGDYQSDGSAMTRILVWKLDP